MERISSRHPIYARMPQVGREAREVRICDLLCSREAAYLEFKSGGGYVTVPLSDFFADIAAMAAAVRKMQ